jgi:hypothetical protein
MDRETAKLLRRFVASVELIDGAHCCMEHGNVIPIRSHVENGGKHER